MDFDLHGIVGIRLVDPTPSDAAMVRRQLGPMERPLDREPDVVVRFVDELPITDLRFIDFERTGFTDDGFYVLQSRKRAARVRIPFEGIGERCEIVCQRGVNAVPLLMAIVTVTALARGCVPLHASAFEYEGTGVLVTGWAKGGKTEALLAFSAHGARYVGDEWILLTADGRRMYGIPEFIRLQDWHLRQLPSVRLRVAATRRIFFRTVRGIDRAHGLLARGPLGRSSAVRTLGEALPALRRQLNLQMNPADVFRGDPGAFEGVPEKVFLMMSHDLPSYRIEPVAPGEVAQRMIASNMYEQRVLFDAYLAHRFAFPQLRSPLLDEAESLQSAMLQRALSGRETFVVRHPYPCDLGRLFDTMVPHCVAARVSRGRGAVVGPPTGLREVNVNTGLRA